MVRYLQEEEKQRCRQLWEEAFPEDTASFCDYYFQEKTKDNRILVREEDGIIQTMLHLNPYRLLVHGQTWRVDYIVGVATTADNRRRGYMQELLINMFRELYEEEMPFVFLMPAAKEIYLPYDFVYIFDQPVWELKDQQQLHRETMFPAAARGDWQRADDQGQPSAGILQTDGFGWRKRLVEVAAWMNHWLESRYEVYTLRDEAYLDRLGKELISENGTMELIYDGGKMVGISGMWGTKESEQRFLYCEAGYCREVKFNPAIMARIINVKSFIKVIRLRKSYGMDEMHIRLRIIDSWIAENDGLWDWYLTKEMSWMENAVQHELEAAQIGGTKEELLELTIAELTGWLFGYSVPKTAVSYEPMVQSLQGVFLDEIV